MSAVRRAWSPQDTRDAAVAARAVETKGYAAGGVLPARPRVLCEYVIPASAAPRLGIGRDWLARLNADPTPVSKVRGRTRGRHRARRLSPIRVWDLGVSL